MKINRVYHHYLKCEEFKSNMWKQIDPSLREKAIKDSADLMIDYLEFESVCKKVVDEWPYSCEASLTASVINHQAWIGHAACAMSHGASEDLTRLGWRSMTKDQQDLANMAADNAISYWKEKYVQNLQNR